MEKDQKPYLIRAFYDWIVDSGYTPHLQFQSNYPGVVAPSGFDKDGVMVLNISNQATNRLQLGDQSIDFEARFKGKSKMVSIPMPAVLGIFAKENVQGIGFPAPDLEKALQEASNSSTQGKKEGDKRDRSHLRVIH